MLWCVQESFTSSPVLARLTQLLDLDVELSLFRDPLERYWTSLTGLTCLHVRCLFRELPPGLTGLTELRSLTVQDVCRGRLMMGPYLQRLETLTIVGLHPVSVRHLAAATKLQRLILCDIADSQTTLAKDDVALLSSMPRVQVLHVKSVNDILPTGMSIW